MRPSKATEIKKVASELVGEVVTVLRDDIGLPLDLDQQLLLLTRLKAACERIAAGGNGGERASGG